MKLNNIQIDALKELGNIGAGHAATALSKLIKRSIMIDIPITKLINKNNLADLYNLGKEFFAVEFIILGEVTGKNLFIIEKNEGLSVVNNLLTSNLTMKDTESDNFTSTLKEIANILTANYLGAMGDMINILMIPSIPTLYHGTLEFIFHESLNKDDIGDDFFIVKTNLKDSKNEFFPFFMLAPHENGMNFIFSKLGLV